MGSMCEKSGGRGRKAMFTGLVESVGHLVAREGQDEVLFTLAAAWTPDTYAKGESIACDGACMTVVEWGPHAQGSQFSFVASAESLALTTLRDWLPGQVVNLERALKFGDALGGHLVSGHIDGRARLVARTQENESLRMQFKVSEDFAALIAPKGSVTLNGVSLTTNEVAGARFGVNLVPHTIDATNLGTLNIGDTVNFEVDTLARYVARHMQVREA